jgi:uncharacterized protein (TIGR04141 family)
MVASKPELTAMNPTKPSTHGSNNRQTVTIFRLRSAALPDIRLSFPPTGGKALKPDIGIEGYFYPLPDEPEVPDWLTSIELVCAHDNDSQKNPLRGQHPGGVLVMTKGTMDYLLTFGTAWMKIRDEWIDLDFGRRVTLNVTPKGGLSEVKSEQVFAGWHMAQERSPSPSKVERFNVEANRDLVHGVEGRPKTDDALILGARVSGHSALHATIDFTKLSEVIEYLEDVQSRSTYKTDWKALSGLSRVSDSVISTQLDADLDSFLRALPANGFSVPILSAPATKRFPDLFPYSFRIGKMKKAGKSAAATEPYLYAGNWISTLRKQKKSPSLETARRTPVHMFDSHEKELDQLQTTVYKCLGFETQLTIAGISRAFVLSSGHWYEAEDSLVASVTKCVEALTAPTFLRLKAWDQLMNEDAYNLACAAPANGLHLLDRKNIFYGGGSSQFELCDLLDVQNRTLYFVKHIGKSSQMSHLGEQVRRTVELLYGPDSGFRTAVESMFTKKCPALAGTFSTRPRPGDFKLCLVSMGVRPTDFPFFAKVGLTKVVTELEHAGHDVHVLTV